MVLATSLFMGELGCSGRGSGKMVHGEGAKFYIEALKVRTQDEAKCLELLDKSIELLPTESAYFHRGWIYAKQGKFEQAQENVRAGLELEPTSSNLLWLEAELKKPVDKRSFKAPPSVGK